MGDGGCPLTNSGVGVGGLAGRCATVKVSVYRGLCGVWRRAEPDVARAEDGLTANDRFLPRSFGELVRLAASIRAIRTFPPPFQNVLVECVSCSGGTKLPIANPSHQKVAPRAKA